MKLYDWSVANLRWPLILFLLLSPLGCTSTPANTPPVIAPQAGQMKAQEIGLHRLTANVPGVGPVKYAVEVPRTYRDNQPAPLVLLLHHGYRGPTPAPYTGANMIGVFRQGLVELEAVAIAPDVVGGNWRDPRNEKAAVWLVQSAMRSYNIDPARIIVMGFSMGGEGTWFIGSRHQDLFAAAVPIAAPVAGSTQWKIPVYVIHSEADEIVSYEAARAHAEAVKAAGGTVEFRSITGLTHYQISEYGSHFRDAARWIETQ